MFELDDVLLDLRDVGIRRLPEAGDAGDRRVRNMLEAEMTRGHRRLASARRSARIWRADRIMHPRRIALAGGIAVVALAIGGVLGVRGISNPPSALAAEMDQLARVAASQDWTGIPGPGQYLYTESHSPHLAAGNWTSCQVSYDEDDQTWIATDGSGAIRKSYNDLQFASPTAKAACASHGVTDPNSVMPNPFRGGTRFPAGGVGFPTKDWKSLSTDPATLLKQVHQQDGGPDTPAEWFTNVADFMRYSDVPPVIRAVLYHATALIPGVKLLGTRTTHDGQTGLAVAFYANGKPTQELIFDQQTGRLLGEQYYNNGGIGPDWVDYVDQKIVGSVPDYPLDHK
jgi:hypothetical protein